MESSRAAPEIINIIRLIVWDCMDTRTYFMRRAKIHKKDALMYNTSLFFGFSFLGQ